MTATFGFPIFSGVPEFWQAWFSIAMTIVVYVFAWKITLFSQSRRWQVHRRRSQPPVDSPDLLWVFLVPAMNEQITIRQTVDRLLALDADHKRVVVIDDGSDDATAEILASVDSPDLSVLKRTLPEAQKGKADALNDAYRRLAKVVEETGFPRERVIITIVDADGYLDNDAPRQVGWYFANPQVGGLQLQVRVYNRGTPLTWFQDLEFAVFGYLFQAGRSMWNTACMGGSGQINRLSALDDIADGVGPWRDKLTEDQDLGLRLMIAGWQLSHDLHCCVHQQGVNSIRRLLRQRVRWSQGNLQTLPMWKEIWQSDLPLPARMELIGFLVMPFLQAIIGVALIGAIWLAATGKAGFIPTGSIALLLLFYLLGVGGVVLGCTASASGKGALAHVRGFAVAHVYVIYTWMLWPVLLRSTARVLLRRDGWDKTEREALASDA
jgi:cellulose synthase/poly-beta-1,6-N-acetylglucosamine synthase-like glycosyltransferase